MGVPGGKGRSQATLLGGGAWVSLGSQDLGSRPGEQTPCWPKAPKDGLMDIAQACCEPQGEPQKSCSGEAGVGRKRSVVCAAWGLPSEAEGQELAGEARLRQSVSNGHLAVTPEPSLAFGAAVRRAPGPCLLITTN